MTTETKPPVLVVLQLTGGNDYLNSVVPYANSNYFDNRKGSLRVEEEDVLNVRIQKLQVNLQSQQMISLNRQKRYIQIKTMDTKRLYM